MSPGAQRPGPWKPALPSLLGVAAGSAGETRGWGGVGRHLKTGTAGAGIRDASTHRGVLQRSSWGQEETETGT